jgi:hypothetical protein
LSGLSAAEPPTANSSKVHSSAAPAGCSHSEMAQWSPAVGVRLQIMLHPGAD